MQRRRVINILLAALATATLCVHCASQTARAVPEVSLQTKPVHETDVKKEPVQATPAKSDTVRETKLESKPVQETSWKERPVRDVALNSPFPLDTSPSGRPKAIEIRSKEQMTERDREEVAGAESSIQEHAGFAGIDFNRGNWSYRQIDCRAFPNHIFLTYTRNNGVGDVSVFSAAIPRSGEDQVRIIPIQLRGYSLFSPAPINALTISAFNHIRADEPTRESTDWLGTGLCYAALAGARVQLPELSADGGKEKLPRGTGAIMEIPSQGGAVIRFVDAAAAPRPMEWTLTFNGKGHLLKAAHLPAATVTAKPVPQMAANAR